MADENPKVTADEIVEALQASYAAPILQAAMQGIDVRSIHQDSGPFDVVSARPPWIVCIYDDPKPGNLSQGPDGFDLKSLKTAIEAASLAAIMACDPIEEIYARAAAAAVIDRKNALLIETWPPHDSLWLDLIKKTNPEIQLARGTTPSGTA